MKELELPPPASIFPAVIRRIIIPLGIFACFVIAILLFAMDRQPAYRGRTVETWALMLKSPDPSEAREAQTAFRTFGSNAIPKLIRMLTEPDTLIGARVRDAVVKSPAPIRIRLPKHMLRESPEWRNLCAAHAIGVLGKEGATAVNALAGVMENGPPPLRLEAASALSAIGSPSLPQLMQSATNRNAEVRTLAAYALGSMGSEASPAIPALVALLDDDDSNVRAKAIWSLAGIGPPSRPDLDRKVRHGTGPGRIAAAETYVKVASSHADALQHLELLLSDTDERVRLGGLELVAKLPGRGLASIMILTNALADSAAGVRSAAAVALADSSPPYRPSIIPVLTAVARQDAAPEVRNAAQQSLDALAQKAATGPR